MKKVLSIIIIIILFVQFTACKAENEKPNIKVYNYVNDYEAVLNIDNIKLTPSKGSMLAFESDLSAEEIMNALSESNPQITLIKLNNREFLAKYNENCPYILFSKNVCDKNENIVDDVYVVMSESGEFNEINHDIPYESINIWYPTHLTSHYFTYEKTNDETYTLETNNNNPFESYVYLNESTSVFTDIVKFYEDCGYEVQYEGGNLTSGIIFVTPNTDDTNPFRILVMKKNNTYAMQYGIINKDLKQQVVTPITDYIDALNTKNAEEYLSCFEDIDKSSIDVFLNNVKSRDLNNAELFWADKENQEYIFKVDYTLVSEDGKMMGSLGAGEHTLVEYFVVGSDNKEHKILNHYGLLDDSIRELIIRSLHKMKKTKKTLLLIGFIVCSSLLSACGGLHSSNKIYAKNLITGKSLTIPIDVYNYADTGNFSNFTTHLSFSELQKEFESADAVNTAINIYHTLSTGYMKLETTNGNFYVKYNSSNNGDYNYSLFADVGRAEEFGEYIYIPFYMLEEFSNSDYPANATPFEGEVYYKEFYDINDFAEYYRDKEIYDVEKLNDTALLITDKSNSYSFTIKLFDEGMFVLDAK